MSEPKRVLLFWPSFSHFYPRAVQNFYRLIVHAIHNCPQYRFDPWVVERSPVHSAMNRAVEAALSQGHEYLIAFDDDCIPELNEFPEGDPRRWQVIPRLLALGEMGHPIVSGVGYMRGYPHTTTIGRKYEFGTALVLDNADGHEEPIMKGFRWMDSLDAHRDELDENGLLEVDFCGVPVVCIHRSVLLKVEKPLFETRDDIGGQSTHDVYFCNKAKAAGFRIQVDTHIDCGHIVEAPIINRLTKASMLAALKPATKREEEKDGAYHR